MSGTVFGPELFTFLRSLKRNNTRPWFEKNKPRYEHDVKEPVLEFIRAAQPGVRAMSEQLVCDPRPVGGSMFRIYRDTRFSKDKTPYKTHASAHFRHRAGKDVHAPGVYVHLEPGEVFVAAGLWHPETEQAQKIRRSIAANGEAWKRAIGSREFRKLAVLGGESLKRPPKGFDPEHPLLEHLKRKDWIASVQIGEKVATSPAFLDRFAAALKVLTPMMSFLTRASGFPF